MNLTPEQKDVGRENFFAAVGSKDLRRDFLVKAVRDEISSGNGLGTYYFGYGTVDRPVRVAVLGTGDEGSVLIGALNPEYVEVAAIADIRPYSVHRAFHGDVYSDAALKARCGLMAKYGWKSEDEARKHVKVYQDYRDLLKAEKDIDGVIIALPLHLHAPAAIAAMRAGMHVLTEKLMGHSVHECKEMARVAEETGKYLATGHQRHYNILYDNAVKLLTSGALGELHYIRAQWHRGNLPGKDSWQQPMPAAVKLDDPQAKVLADELKKWEEAMQKAKGAERDLWERRVAQKRAQLADEVLKDAAKKYGYEDKDVPGSDGKIVYRRPAAEELLRWRLWDRTGGGLMAELGSHQLDAASIFVAAVHGGEKQVPLSVAASATRPLFPADRDIDDHVFCLYEFPAPGYDGKDKVAKLRKIGVQYASINGNGFGGYGETVFGTQGTLVLERELEAMLWRTHEVESKIKLVENSKTKTPELKVDDAGDKGAAAVGYQAMGEVERGYTEQIEHWAWCIRNPAPENQPKCHPKVAMGDAVIALTTNLAARKGERIEFDPAWFDPHRDETPEGVTPNPNDAKRYPAL